MSGIKTMLVSTPKREKYRASTIKADDVLAVPKFFYLVIDIH